MAADTGVSLTALFSGPDAPSEEDLYKCIHCGFCLQACPTYLETGLETESPRGRIALMKAVNEGRIGITPTVFRHWDLCIQCRACEVACPSGVPYGRLIEATMAQVERHREAPLVPRLLGKALLEQVIPYQERLSLLAMGLRLYQATGVQWAVRRTGLLRLFSSGLAELEKSSPRFSGRPLTAAGQEVKAVGKKCGRVALLTGCVMPLVNGPEMRAVTRVLARNGYTVEVTKGQACCGAISSHVGDLETSRALARRNIDAFPTSVLAAVVVASGGCGVRMKEYGDLLRDDPAYAQKALEFSEAVKDVHEFLVDISFNAPKGHVPRRVTYQDSCHLSHAQRITDAPRQVLRSIPGIEFAEMENSAGCCGAGGTYSITEREFSLRVLDSKMEKVRDTQADIVATANPGCLVQLQLGVRRARLPMKVQYITDLLDEAYSSE